MDFRVLGPLEVAIAREPVPIPAAKQPDTLLALTAWRSIYDVPEEILIKTIPEDEGPTSVATAVAMSPHRRLQQKPQYVDLTSALSTRVLSRMLDRRTAVDGPDASYLEEALPTIVDGTHASEWVIEIGRPPGGPFHYESPINSAGWG